MSFCKITRRRFPVFSAALFFILALLFVCTSRMPANHNLIEWSGHIIFPIGRYYNGSGINRTLADPSDISLCYTQPRSEIDSPVFRSSKVLIVGASSFIGASIAKLLPSLKTAVQLVVSEDDVNIGIDPLTWYRWEKLIGMGLSPQYMNFSDNGTVFPLIKKYSPEIVIYVPTPLFEKESNKSLRQVTELHENFILLLQTISSVAPKTTFLLISLSKPNTCYESMIKLFELSLSVYHYLYGIRMAIIRTESVYGPWQYESQLDPLCFIDHLVQNISHNIFENLESSCIISYNLGCSDNKQWQNKQGILLTKQWMHDYNSYREHQKKGVIVSTYLTAGIDPRTHMDFINNNYYFMEYWFLGIFKQNLHMAVFHDNLSEAFQSGFLEHCNTCEFVKIKRIKNITPNDQRYLHYYDYILAHPEIGQIVMTDMRDVMIQNDPFEVMNVVGDMAYVGIDIPFEEKPNSSPHITRVYKRCFSGILDYHIDMEMLGFFNAGVLGGSRHVMLAFLTRFQQYLQTSTKKNCNMVIVQHLLHIFFHESTVYGWPFNAGYLTGRASIPGLAISHKWTKLHTFM